jgi:leader peptidase (prepilin peptidase)/N-methyltransferase
VSAPDEPLSEVPTSRRLLAVAALAGGIAAVAVLPPVEAAFAVPFWLLVLAVVASDLDTYTIPDGVSAAIATLGLVRAAVVAGGTDGIQGALADALLQGCGAFLALMAVREIHGRLSGREGLGFGDVKLAGALGVWLGWGSQALALQVAALAALAVVVVAWRRRGGSGRDMAVPLGAFLAPAAFAVHLLVPLIEAWP